MPDGAVASEADNPVLKLSGPLVKLLTLNLVVTCLEKFKTNPSFPFKSREGTIPY